MKRILQAAGKKPPDYFPMDESDVIEELGLELQVIQCTEGSGITDRLELR